MSRVPSYLILFGAVILSLPVVLALLIRRALGEFLIISSIVGWQIDSLARATEIHGHEEWTQAFGYLS